MDLKNSHLKQYLITPHNEGGERESYSISKFNFLPKKSPNYGGDRDYLIVGFDTEYQRVLNKDGEYIDNEILSYQYHCVVCKNDNEGSEVEWSGLVLPETDKVEDRITLQEFLTISIGKGLKLHPQLKIPSEIYLVAHFTRADIPGFKDFKDSKDSRSNLNFDNIRNSFVNVSRDLPITLYDEDFQQEVKLSVKVRDTLSLAPSGKGKLEDIGQVLNFEKIKLDEDDGKDLYYKQNMKQFRLDHWDLFKEYAIRDASICAYYTNRMIRLYKEQTGKFKLPVTLTSIGVDLIQQYWRDHGMDPYRTVGKELEVKKVFNKKLNQFRTKKKLVDVKKLHFASPLLTECYHGGRNEQFWFGPSYKSEWYDYDLASAYPTAMFLIGEVDWDDLKQLQDLNDLLTSKPPDMVFADVDFEFPKDVRFPVLPVRTESGIIFPRKGTTSTHISEILLAKSLGCKFSLNYGIRIGQKRHPRVREKDGETIGSVQRPFDGFTRYCIDKRSQHPKKSLENLFWKELTNSTYGKTAQGLRERRVYDLKAEDTKRLEPSKITNPAYAAYITAFCRGTLSEIMNNLPNEVDIFSVTTDGFLTTATHQQMEEATNGVLCRYYKSSRRVLGNSETIFEVKHLIQQPLGWRTRGQATLLPSTEHDWTLTENPSEGCIEENRYVLAKAGIKVSKTLSKRQENKEILKLFFQREPEQLLDVNLGKGIREMYEDGLDFVDYTFKKRLSMEFDWKRKPKFVGEVDVKIPNIDCDRHLFFSTQPWDSLKEYNQMRFIWEQYNKDKNHNLKNLEDYRLFNEYFEARMSMDNEDVGKWLKKVNGPLNRLRRDIVIAEKYERGGLYYRKRNPLGLNYNNFPRKRFKAKELHEILSTILQIDIKLDDITNARKVKVFKPNQVPRTQQTIEMLSKLKVEVFPHLEINQFLTPITGFNIDSCELNDCIHSQKMYQN